ncbi:ABC transporter ATP-binding protein [Mycobacterium sp. 3519A]|uniref:ABC transporter ATP-binding protein n=1 Tax=Mycobacterium sp. 3519A TaxID=2057184 RepID=UPI000C7A6FAA|nr:ABC transporter ATP-binding protein [Mycobacterium sp. 3519A]
MPSNGRDIALQVRGLGKRYQLGERESYQALRDVIGRRISRPLKRLRGAPQGPTRQTGSFWALRDVTFSVSQGEALGIIGRNGAGKTTLLKILSRITEPSEGEAVVYGRAGALLEVGTGFHPELTGKENILLNGALLGMRKSEIRASMDDIIDFAGVQLFVDTPVKRYSTGMRARLAFAVAAFLQSDILIVDEVLAVGDAEFQRKCMGRMGDAANSGRTVLFVSHNMAAIEALCRRSIWLEGGRCVADGPSSEVVSRYLSTSFSALSERFWPDINSAPGNDFVRLRRAAVRPEGGSAADSIDVHTPIAVEIEYWNFRDGALLNLSLHVYNEQGIKIFNALPYLERVWQGRPFPTGLYRDTCHIPADLLNDGMHRIELMVIGDGNYLIYQVDDLLVFDVRDVSASRDGWFGEWEGAVRPQLAWETEQLLESDPACGAARD